MLLGKGDAILYLLCFILGIGLHEELYKFIKSIDFCLSSCIWVENQRQKRSVKELFGQKIACDLGLKTVNFKGKYPNWFTVILRYDDNMFFFSSAVHGCILNSFNSFPGHCLPVMMLAIGLMILVGFDVVILEL